MGNNTDQPKPATLRRRARKALLLAGKVPLDQQNHGDQYWARNWGCECLNCKSAVSKLNNEQYLKRVAKAKELRGSK